MALFYFSSSPWFLLEFPLFLSVSWHFLNIQVCALWIVPISPSDFWLLRAFFLSYPFTVPFCLLSVSMSSNPSFSSHYFLKELMNSYILSLLVFHPQTYFSPLPQLHIPRSKLDYSLHTIVIDRHSSSYSLKLVLIY